MAITKQILNNETGGVFPNAYVNIRSFNGDKYVINYCVSVYVDNQARENNKKSILNYDFQMTLLTNLTFADLYTDLKSRPEFAGATDC